MANLSDLIARVEAASKLSREVDRLVAKIAGWHRISPKHMRNKHGGWIAPQDWIGAYSDGSPILDSLHGTDIHRDVPEFTASIDAALTLLPDGYDWIIGNVNGMYGGTPYACVGDTEQHFAATPCLALLAAILRARQAADTEGAK